MDSESVKKTVIRQIQAESNQSNARILIEKINQACFDKCFPKPGGSTSSTEQTCVTQCMEKYMAAWNSVHQGYIARIQREHGN
ncbi:hypothetical protein P8C59_004689 [Phyllachora maydis]|uniref:Mitochondrial import inner membrane translocase subunit n=1 Tax=Phyllachora maydis TaxID=1825666 RepID=A0AAD9MCQ4_9PEZI|nr:hypothetical protein P8C59_004689 [Phyllachora maydis]